MEKVVLVDEQDAVLGYMEKMEAHRKGVLHRAFSVFIFNSSGEMLLQQRASEKYHSPRLWTNTCCSHPREREAVIDAAQRRLNEEMGFECDITKSFDFIYKANLDQGLMEHELDHVFVGYYDGDINLNEDEVMDYKYMPVQGIIDDIELNPDNYTIWFKIALPILIARMEA